MIFVTLGTSHHPFRRLLVALDHLVGNGILENVTAQIGRTLYRPRHYAYADFFSRQEQIQHFRRAEFVIAHGGEGTLEECLALKKKVIVVPRREDRGEAPDDHQLEVADFLEQADRALVVREIVELEQALGRVRDWQPQFAVDQGDPTVVEMVRSFIEHTIHENGWRRGNGRDPGA